MIKTKLVLILATVTSLASSGIFANIVELPLGDTEGTFYCEVNTMNASKTVEIYADDVEVKGFCRDQRYVKRKGYIRGMPMHVLKKIYFEYRKDASIEGSVNIIPPSVDDVNCKLGKEENRKVYSGGNYC